MSIWRPKTYRTRNPDPGPEKIVMSMSRPENMLTTTEAADFLGVHPRSVAKAVARGRLRAYRWGTGEKAPHLFKVDELNAYKVQRQQGGRAKPGRKSDTSPARWSGRSNGPLSIPTDSNQ